MNAAVLALALGLGCRASAPESVTLGVAAYGARQYLGTLPFWEGPEQYGHGFAASPHSFAVSTGREMEGLVAEIWRADGRVRLSTNVLPGSIVAQATDGLGNVIYFRRHLNAKGDLYDPVNDRLYLGNLRQRGPARTLDLPTHNGSMLTAVCGFPGRFTAWVRAPDGYTARTFTAATVDAPSAETQKWSPFWCAADDHCAAAVLDHNADPQHLRVDCDGRTSEVALEGRWPTATIVHPEGTLTSFDSQDRRSTVVVRTPERPPRTFSIAGTA